MTETDEDRVDRPACLGMTRLGLVDDPGGRWHGGMHQQHERVATVHVDHQKVDVVGRVDLDIGELDHGLTVVRQSLVLGVPGPEIGQAVVRDPSAGRARLLPRRQDS